LIEANLRRVEQLDDFLNQKTAEHSNAVREIQSQYSNLVGQIQSDLRFNDRQRVDAIRSANAALLQRISEIKQSQFNYQQQVNALKSNYAQGIQEVVNSYTAPSNNTESILSQTFQAPQQKNPQTIGLKDDEEQSYLSQAFG